MKSIILVTILALVGLGAVGHHAEASSHMQVAATATGGCEVVPDATHISNGVKCWGMLQGERCYLNFITHVYTCVANPGTPQDQPNYGPNLYPGPGGYGITAIAAGYGGYCIIQQLGGVNTGKVYCWGDNTYGQIGQGTTGGHYQVPTLVTGLPASATDLVGGGNHFCAITSRAGSSDDGGELWCWGQGTYGQLGYSTSGTANQATPVKVVIASKGAHYPHWFTITAGGWHTCGAVGLTGASGGTQTIECWGYNYWGQLGNYETTLCSGGGDGIGGRLPGCHDQLTAAPMHDNSGAVWTSPINDIAGYNESTCIVNSDGTLYCAGNLGDIDPDFYDSDCWYNPNLNGVCGILSNGGNYSAYRNSATFVDGGPGINGLGTKIYKRLAQGPTANHMCAKIKDSSTQAYSTFCIGADEHGEVGIGPVTCGGDPLCWMALFANAGGAGGVEPDATNVLFPDTTSSEYMAVGAGFTFAKAANGSFYSWGTNASDQLCDNVNGGADQYSSVGMIGLP